MKIRNLTAYPISFPIPEDKSVTLGIGRAIKRDAVLVKVETTRPIGNLLAGELPGRGAKPPAEEPVAD